MERFLTEAERLVWGWPLLFLILGTGLYLTIRLRALTFRRMGLAMRLLVRKEDGGQGISSFAALCTALSAVIGTGNIVGVATALALGGPGALVWMELSALTGIAVKYAEGFLAVRYRFTAPDGSHSGGPFAYIELGLGRRWKWLGTCFALLGALAGICGVGTFVQIGTVTACLRAYMTRCFPMAPAAVILRQSYPAAVVALGIGMTLLSAVLVFGGIRRISGASVVLVPVMGGLYLFCCLWILACRLPALPGILRLCLRSAFTGRAAAGGLLGTIQAGVSRGVFSNEAGLGTAPMAAASVRSKDPVEQGLISMTAVVFDTLLVCTLTGLALLSVGQRAGQGGVLSVLDAFAAGLPLQEELSMGIVLLCLFLFSFTTAAGWSFYGLRCLSYLISQRPLAELLYKTVYVLTILIAPYLPIQSIWTAANLFNGLMAVPNLLAILLLSDRVVLDSRDIIKKRGWAKHETAVSGRPGRGLRQTGRRFVHR